jgi:hypothetical protein
MPMTTRLILRTAGRPAATTAFRVPQWTRRAFASVSDEKDLVIIGGGVAGYVAAIKAGQEGMKVRGGRPRALLPAGFQSSWSFGYLGIWVMMLILDARSHVSKSVARLAEPASTSVASLRSRC